MMQQAASRVDFNRKSSLLPAWTTKCKSRVSWVQCVTLSKVPLSEIFMHPKDSERTLWPAPDVPLIYIIYICIFLQSMRDCNSRLLAKALFFSTDVYGCYFHHSLTRKFSFANTPTSFPAPVIFLCKLSLAMRVRHHFIWEHAERGAYHWCQGVPWVFQPLAVESLGCEHQSRQIFLAHLQFHVWGISSTLVSVDAANRLPKDSIRKTWIKQVRAMLVCREIENSKNWGPCEIFCHYDHYQYCFFMARIFQE